MTSQARRVFAALALWAVGCGGDEQPSGAAATAGDSARAATGADSAVLATTAESLKTLQKAVARERADSVKRAQSRARRDSTFGPRFEVDSTGKVVPVRKKP